MADDTLEAFAREHRAATTKCWTCNIPERDEIDAARRAGTVTVSTMVEWLKSKGREATQARLNYHFTAKHYE